MAESAEANVLHAVMDGDMAEARRLLGGFLPGELREMEAAVEAVTELIGDVRARA